MADGVDFERTPTTAGHALSQHSTAKQTAKPDIAMAAAFLNVLDPEAKRWTFQTFTDRKGGGGKDPLAQIFNGTLDEHFSTLSRLNSRGAGVYVTVNKTDLKGRHKTNILRVRAVWQEDDGQGKPLPLEPHIVTETSFKHFHRLLLTDKLSFEQFASTMDVMVERYGSDPNAKDLSRVLRLPGFFHRSGHQVRMVETSAAQPYTAEQILAAFPPGRGKSQPTPNEGRPLSDEQLRGIQGALEVIPADDRDTWLKVGMALESTGTGSQAFDIWTQWSRKAKGKYDAEDQGRVWGSFQGRGTKLGSLFWLAKQHGWRGREWLEPQPLTAKADPEPYPLDALPDTIRAAVSEVADFVRAPIPLVVSSALSALSLTCQGYGDIKRAERLSGPSGLFFLSIADSGERKSTCDGFFTSAIRSHQEERAEALKPEIERNKAAIAAWVARRDGLVNAIKSASGKLKSTTELEDNLAHLQKQKPEPVRVPRLLLGDETPENLAWSLAKQWPSAGVLSSEAGLILGAHAMNKDSVMRNLALLNILWDGGSHSIGRRTTESFTVKGARFTLGLQIQEVTLRAFFGRTGELARGTGFLARFLVAWPESTQGYRPFSEAPANWPYLSAFHRRIAAVLDNEPPIGEDGALTPAMLALSPAAKAAWVEYHDAIEAELRSGGELYDVRDVASKSADNAARLAALFHIFEQGTGAISLEAFEGAARIAAWHLNESRRFFGELALPAEWVDAARLDAWLLEYCRREHASAVGKNHVRRYGPIRDKQRLDAAINELSGLYRARLGKQNGILTIFVNPAILAIPQ